MLTCGENLHCLPELVKEIHKVFLAATMREKPSKHLLYQASESSKHANMDIAWSPFSEQWLHSKKKLSRIRYIYMRNVHFQNMFPIATATFQTIYRILLHNWLGWDCIGRAHILSYIFLFFFFSVVNHLFSFNFLQIPVLLFCSQTICCIWISLISLCIWIPRVACSTYDKLSPPHFPTNWLFTNIEPGSFTSLWPPLSNHQHMLTSWYS